MLALGPTLVLAHRGVWHVRHGIVREHAQAAELGGALGRAIARVGSREMAPERARELGAVLEPIGWPAREGLLADPREASRKAGGRRPHVRRAALGDPVDR